MVNGNPMPMKEQRHFRRYPMVSDITLKLRTKYYTAKILNYSPWGIGAVIENITTIGKGDVIELTAENPEIKTFGEGAWSLIERPVLRIGVKNVGQMRGLTRNYRLADVLIGLQRSQKTGILTVESGKIVKKVYIRNGDMIFAASNQKEDRLGDILLREGRINIEQYNQSVIEMKKTNQRQGIALVRLGYLEPKELIRAFL